MPLRLLIPALVSAATVPLTLIALLRRGRILDRRYRAADPFSSRPPLRTTSA